MLVEEHHIMKRPRVAARNGLLSALDIGTSKICCFIARVAGDERPSVIGIGHQLSRGVRTGAIIDMEQAETALRATVHAAEQMAGETISEVIINLSGGYPASQTVGVEVPLSGREVADQDLHRVLAQGHQVNGAHDRRLIHSIPVGYSIDGSRGIRDPRGMYGERLGVDMHVITAATGAVKNLTGCVARCHLETRAIVVSPYAAGMAALVNDEMDLGVTVVDMGAGTTSVAVFFDGQVVYTDSVPIGGGHVTNDIARGLSTPLIHAERVKTLYGNCIATPADEREIIHVPQVGEEEFGIPNQIPRSILIGIVQPRLEETFELVRSRLESSGFDKIAGRRVVLTGGASQLGGIRELAALVLDKQVRMGRPIRTHGLADATAGPAFAVAAGLLAFALDAETHQPRPNRAGATSGTGMLGRFGSWLKENF